jgi:hypothetical protein
VQHASTRCQHVISKPKVYELHDLLQVSGFNRGRSDKPAGST